MRGGLLGRVAFVLPLLCPLTALNAQTLQLGNDVSLSLSGIISASLYLSDARFGLGEGQQANFVTSELEDGFHGADVRSTRLTARLTGPEFSGNWRASAVVEGDLFGGFNGAGAFGDEQPVPRLRL